MASLIRSLLLLSLVFAAAHGGRAEQPKIKVIAIEAAMRAWQERYQQTTSSYAYWQPRSDGTEPGKFPADCFYGADLLNPQKAADLVNNLFDEMKFNVVGKWAKRESEVLVENPSLIDWEGISLFSLPRATPDNYVVVFTELVNVIRRCNILLPDAFSSFSPLTEVRRSDVSFAGSGGALTCEEAKQRINDGILASKRPLTSTSGHLGISATIQYNSFFNRYSAFVTAWEGRYQYSLVRNTGSATLYIRNYSSPSASQGFLGMNPQTLLNVQTEPAVTGGIWASQIYAFNQVPDDIGCPGPGLFEVKQSRFQRVRMVVRPTYQHHVEDILVECAACEACATDCTAGKCTTKVGSLDAVISLGGGPDGSAGALLLDAELPSAVLSTPFGLKKRLQAGARALLDVNTLGPTGYALMRQVLAPQALVDIVALDSFAYEIRFYTVANKGTLNAQGFYVPVGLPYRVLKIENPDRSATVFNRLRITPSGDGGGETSTFTYEESTKTWTLVKEKDGVTITESRSSVIDAATNRRTEVHLLKDGAGQVVLHERNVYQVFPWNTSPNALKSEELVETVADPDGAARKTSYTFYSDSAADGAGYGRVKYQVDPGGFWQKFDYDSAGRVQRVTTPFLNASLGATDNVRVRETFYSTAQPHETNIGALVLGGTRTETSRSYRNFNYNIITELICQTAGAPHTAADNLVTVTKHHSSGDGWGKLASIVRPDGTGTFYTYVRNADGGLTTTITTGALNATRTAVIDGTRAISTVNSAGERVEETVRDIASNLLTGYELATQIDGFGRVTRREFLDGTFEVKSYSCCGVEFVVDREGVRTDYTYDALGRVETEKTGGITRRYTYDAAGRRLTTTRVGTDGSSIVLETNVYDLTGRLSSITTRGRTITFSEVVDAAGQTIRTSLYPDAGTRIETLALDGSRMSVGGTAALPKKYEYGADADGAFVREISVGSGDAMSEWTKTSTDFLGRAYKIAFPDGATMRGYYNAAGQLVRQVDADGVTTLHAYDARGRPEHVAVDVNRNGVIDFDGQDRVTSTRHQVVTRQGTTVFRTTTTAWLPTGGQEIGVIEVTPNGRQRWETVHGLTTAINVTLNGTGGRSETTTGPDGLVSQRSFQAGRLVSTQRSHPALGQLGATTYAYDAHGRVQSQTDARNGATTYSYFPDDQLRTATTPDPDASRTGPGYDPQTTTYGYDNAGRQNSVTAPDGRVTNATYYPTGHVKRIWGARTYPAEYTFDPQGRVKTLTTWQNFAGDAGRAVTTWNYDAQRGRLLNKLHADSAGPRYTYTAGGRLKTRVWARGITATYDYNNAGDLGTIAYSDGTPGVAYTYDSLGRVATKSDGSGTCSYAYVGLTSLIAAETHSTGLLAGRTLTRGYDAQFRVETVGATDVAATSYAYDAASRLRTVTLGTDVATYAYTPNSLLIASVTIQRGGVTRLTTGRTHDQLNRLAGVTNLPGTASDALSFAYTYDAANQRVRVTREDNTAWRYDYDGLGQVTAAQKQMADATPMVGRDYGYAFDDIGNRRTTIVNGRTAHYSANLLNQYGQRTVPPAIDVLGLADPAATVTVNLQPTQRQGSVFYRAVGIDNSTAAQHPSILLSGVKNNAGPNGEDAVATETRQAFLARTPEVFAHDADGNLTSDSRWIYTWDGENRLIAMETPPTLAAAFPALKQRLEFAYDGYGRRVQKKVLTWTGSGYVTAQDLRFVYDGWNLIAELDGQNANAVLRTHVWGSDLSGTPQGAGGVGGLLFTGGPTGNHAVASDGNGNVAGLFAMSDGTSAAIYEYGAFGEPLRASGPAAASNPFRFSTKYTDGESGLLYYGLRYYDTLAGRWLSRDAIDEFGGMNLYALVENNPAGRYDILGSWGPGGHFYTEVMLAYIKGASASEAFEAGYWAQYADQFAPTDAYSLWRAMHGSDKIRKEVAQFVNGSDEITDAELKAWSVQVMQTFHSLTGGDEAAVCARRDCLRKLLAGSSLQPWQKGFLRHALGDTYAHVEEKDGEIHAYSAPNGHGFDSAWEKGSAGLSDSDPDQIHNFPDRYRAYIKTEGWPTGPKARKDVFIRLLKAIPNIPAGASKENEFMRKLVQDTLNSKFTYDPAIEGSRILNNSKFAPPSFTDIKKLSDQIKDACK